MSVKLAIDGSDFGWEKDPFNEIDVVGQGGGRLPPAIAESDPR